jgi:8-oxo-dGTP pyrophosphatase MutT (NUDIX family)
VVIRYKNEVLLIRSNFGEQKWGLPGGGIKRNETAAQSAAREVQEEVGISLNPSKLRFITEQRSGYGPLDWPYVHLRFYEYRLNKKPKQLKLQGWEVSESKWVAQSSAINMTGRQASNLLRRVFDKKIIK